MNIPNNTPETSSPIERIQLLFETLSKNKDISRDQERIGKDIAAYPGLSLITNRLINQGSDPESLRMVSPDAFKKVAETLGLTEETASQAITNAHIRGPASLENESAEEALWLLLSSVSAPEEAKGELKSRIIQFAEAIIDLDSFAEFTREDLISRAKAYKEKILSEITPVEEKNGIPVYENDLGFFVAYRKGFKAAMVKTPDIIFVGTTPDTTLEKQKLAVDKMLTPHFGLRFKNSAEKKTQEIVQKTRKDIFKVLTICHGDIQEGGKVETFELKGAKTKIPAILVGEEGRGRSVGVLPVHLTDEQFKEWQEKGFVVIKAAELSKTKTGKPKLIAKKEAESDEKIIAVMPTPIGFRGSNSHTGDRTGEMTKDTLGDEKPVFEKFPGEILAQGTIAQGDAGRMGSGEQIIAVMPKDKVFRTRYGGRLYGGPSSHYYKWTGKDVLAATWDERKSSDIF